MKKIENFSKKEVKKSVIKTFCLLSKEQQNKIIGGNGNNASTPIVPGGAIISAAISGVATLKDCAGA